MSSSDTSPETEEVVEEKDELREQLVADLKELVGDAFIESHIVAGKDLWVRVTNESWADVANSLRYTMGARYFGFVSAIDWMPSPFGRSMDSEVDNVLNPPEEKDAPVQETGYAGGDTRFQVFARFANVKDHWGITVKADAGDENPSIGTLTKVFAGADWHERETWEMYGIDFIGHPALRKLYLPADFEGYPLRKDFPLLSRMVKPWPGIVDVEPMPEVEEPEAEEPKSESTEAGSESSEETE